MWNDHYFASLAHKKTLLAHNAWYNKKDKIALQHLSTSMILSAGYDVEM